MKLRILYNAADKRYYPQEKCLFWWINFHQLYAPDYPYSPGYVVKYNDVDSACNYLDEVIAYKMDAKKRKQALKQRRREEKAKKSLNKVVYEREV